MSGFAGFTEAEIRKLKNGPENDKPKATFKPKQQNPNNRDSKNHKYLSKLTDLTPIPEEAKIEKKTNRIGNYSKEGLLRGKNESKEISKEKRSESDEIPNEREKSTDNEAIKSLKDQGMNASNKQADSSEATISNVPNQELRSAESRKPDPEKSQTRQKLIEEQNRRRKELLAKALEDRTKRTLEEQQRLDRIRDEFRKLDADLSDDVKILRKQIELASVDYMEAEKRYHRIEREFLEAKLRLHRKLEKKEMLTDHLCAIIERNEERKAEKLNELLGKLNVHQEDDLQDSQVSTSNK